MRTRRAGLCLAVVVGLAGAAAADAPGPEQPVAALDDGLLQSMKIGTAGGFAARAKALEPVVDGAFDLPGIVRLVLGPAWTAASADQQQQALAAFRAYTVANYAANFDSFSGQSFRIVPPVKTLGATSVVDTEIGDGHGAPDKIDYAVRQVDGAWKIEDVLLDGTISNLAVQRSDFQDILAKGGLPLLISTLNGKVAALAKGPTQ